MQMRKTISILYKLWGTFILLSEWKKCKILNVRITKARPWLPIAIKKKFICVLSVWKITCGILKNISRTVKILQFWNLLIQKNNNWTNASNILKKFTHFPKRKPLLPIMIWINFTSKLIKFVISLKTINKIKMKSFNKN